jgi:hypothetical protein
MPGCGSGAVVCSCSLLFGCHLGRRQAETPITPLSRFSRPALPSRKPRQASRSRILSSNHLKRLSEECSTITCSLLNEVGYRFVARCGMCVVARCFWTSVSARNGYVCVEISDSVRAQERFCRGLSTFRLVFRQLVQNDYAVTAVFDSSSAVGSSPRATRRARDALCQNRLSG